MKTPFTILWLTLGSLIAAHAQTVGKITYEDNIRPLLENKCFSCHNPDKKKGDLDLTSFGGLMTGGGGGAIVDPGNAEGSRMWTCCAKKEEPYMPPEGAALGQAELDLIAKWIAGGVLETKSSLAKKSTKPKIDMAVAITSGKPEGPIARPEHVLLEPVVVTPRTTAVIAMAASPWTSLIAFAVPKQVLLYDTDTRQLAGVFPYTEGYARSLRFSQNGSLLVMGGGRGGKFGHAVVWDVKTGRRITEVGKEFDQVMSASISPDHKMIAIGSPSKKVKCYSTATGEELYVINKHTEWVLGVNFSPDGVLLASSDRNGNVMVWEAENGGEFYNLGQHKAAVTDLAWRQDSNLLASCSMDGSISVWEMNEGKQVKNWAAHGGGVQSVAFTPDGKIASSGNDGLVRVWDTNGNKLAEAPSQGDLVTKVVALFDSKSVVSASWLGDVKMWSIDKTMADRGPFSSNPPLITQRIAQTEQRIGELNGKAGPAQEAVKKADADAKALDAALAQARTDTTAADARQKALPGEKAAAEKEANDLKALRDKTAKDRDARLAAIKQYGERSAKIAAQEKELAAKPGDPALSAAIAKAKAELGAAPAAVADLDKALADVDAKIKTNKDVIAAKTAEIPKMAAALKASPQRIKDAEAAAAKGKEALATAQTAVKSIADETALMQRMIPALKAAQFNVNVLAEKAKLAKLEGDFNDFTTALKDNEEGKVASAARIVSSRKAIAEAAAALPAKEAALKKQQDELAVVEKNFEPVKAADTAAATKLEEQKMSIAAREAEIAALAKAKDDAIAASKKAAAEMAKQIDVLKKQLADVTPKIAGPAKDVEKRKAELAGAEGALKTVKEAQAAAQKKLDQARATAEAPLKKVAAEAEAAAKDLAATKAVAIGKPEMAAKVAAARQILEAKNKSTAEARKVFDAAKAAIQKEETAVASASKPVADKEKALATAKQLLEAANKILAPITGQQQSLQGSVDARQKDLAAKQAEPAGIEKDAAAKTKIAADAIAQLKGAQPALDKALADAHAKLEAGTKVVEAKRAEVGKALADRDGVKKQKESAEAALAASEKDIPNRDQTIAECKAELAKLQPQLDPMRAKVKQLTDQYLTMLPK